MVRQSQIEDRFRIVSFISSGSALQLGGCRQDEEGAGLRDGLSRLGGDGGWVGPKQVCRGKGFGK